jgi:hypothetical protein
VAEIRDDAGSVRGVVGRGESKELPHGFYRVSPLGPEETGTEQFVVLVAGEHERVSLKLPRAPGHVAALAKALGVKRAAWAQPSTHVAAAIGRVLHGDAEPLRGLGLRKPLEGPSAVAFLAVAGDGDASALRGMRVRIWPAGNPIPAQAKRLRPSAAGVASAVVDAASPEPHWLALEPPRGDATVVALPVLPSRVATVVAQVDADRVRMYQFQPTVGEHESSTRERLLQVEHLERLLLSGRLDGAEALANELAKVAAEDPFGACVAGYVLLRLGRHDELAALASAIAVAAPKLSDAFILRGECEARAGNQDTASQAFADAVNAGIPAFGEGLTRLVEGLRASAFVHPRGALVRHIFQRHARGSMWAAFVPRRQLEPDGLVISGADIGFEG